MFPTCGGKKIKIFIKKTNIHCGWIERFFLSEPNVTFSKPWEKENKKKISVTTSGHFGHSLANLAEITNNKSQMFHTHLVSSYLHTTQFV